MLLKDFVSIFSGFDREDLRKRFNCPFLLEAPGQSVERRILPVQGLEGKPLVLGRTPTCHLTVKDKQVSSRHAQLIPPKGEEGRWELVDLGSTNGTMLNGEPTEMRKSTPIQDGDVLSFGTIPFAFVSSASFLELFFNSMVDRTVANRPDADDITLKGGTLTDSGRHAAKPLPEPSQAITDSVELLVCCEPYSPLPLLVNERLVIGRHVSVDLVLPKGKGQVSRRHAELERRPGGVFVRDLGSTNGTFLGGMRLDDQWYPVPLSVPIEVGEHDILLMIPGPGPRGDETTQAIPI